MGWLLWIYTAVFLACLALLLWVSQKRRQRYALAKGVQSGLFVAGALLAYYTGSQNHPTAFPLLMAALLLCAGGDIALGFANQAAKHKKPGGDAAVGTSGARKIPFLGGAAAFLAAHVVFCLLYFSIRPFHPLSLILPVICVALILTFDLRGLIRTGKLRALCVVYPFLVGLMTSAALSSALAADTSSYALLTVAGSILFLLSDLVLVFLYFGATKRGIYRYANLITYYLGVFLLAMSSHWF